MNVTVTAEEVESLVTKGYTVYVAVVPLTDILAQLNINFLDCCPWFITNIWFAVVPEGTVNVPVYEPVVGEAGKAIVKLP
jgi:hypothetical protein